jgi:hypothetical protein
VAPCGAIEQLLQSREHGGLSDDQEVPAVIQYVSYIALDVTVAVVFRGKKVAGPCVMAFFQKGIADDAGEFAGDENA